MVVCMHVGSSSQAAADRARHAPFMANLPWGADAHRRARCSSWLFSGMFDRIPNLKIALSEGEIGWIPYFLERAEQVVDKQRHWVKRGVGFAATTASRPATSSSTTSTCAPRFRDHVFGCFIDDAHGIASLDEIGEDNVMCETDYPHSDSTWPDCIDLAQSGSRTSRPRCSTRSCGATRSGCSTSKRPSHRPLTDRYSPGMQFHLGLPTDNVAQASEFVTADAIAEMSQAAEAAGFSSVFVTEHPFPEDEWMRSGGHHALDPFVALSFAAAATTTLKVMTFLCVVPYRNPFITAKAALSVHVLSGERLILGVGAGYLKPEFDALGVDFDERNELFDEGLVAMKRAWAEDGVEMTGRHFEARGHTMLPHPQAAPPIWVGGNSKRAIRRAIDLCDGWAPMPYPRELGNRRRSAFLENIDDLKSMLAYADGYRAETGATGRFDVIAMPLVPSSPAFPGYDKARLIDHIAELRDLGIVNLAVHTPADTRGGNRPHR